MDMNALLGAAAGAAATAVCLHGSASGSAAAAAVVGGQDDDPLVVEAVDWAAAHGMLVRPQGTQFDHCPFSLLPTPLPRKAFEAAVALGPLFGKLTDAVARDTEWLHTTLEAAGQGDEFTEQLLQISRTVNKEGLGQQLQLGILRSDYMLHEPTEAEQKLPLFTEQAGVGSVPKQFMQVELNCIASSFGCMGNLTSQLHQYLLSRYPTESAALSAALSSGGDGVAPNHNLTKLPAGIAAAHSAYVKQGGSPGAVVIFVVQDGEANSVDQRLLEYGLWDRHGIKVLRRSLGELHRCASLKENGRGRKSLQVKLEDSTEIEVSVAYYRAGYTPDDYSEGADSPEWAARLLVERSAAVKCPSIDYHLTGAKKVQQALAAPGELERFVSPAEAVQLRSCFAGLFPAEAANAVAAATSNPELFVLKPQREGGGNNFYGADIPRKLQNMDETERKAYILMQRIFPPPQEGRLLRAGKVLRTETVSELGIFSVFLGDGSAGSEPLVNEVAGHMLRTKPVEADEGGVAAGFAVIDSPYLV
jgi:glutathione synthase